MDSFLKNVTGAKDQDQHEGKKNQPSGTSDVFSSAKVVAEAAQTTFSQGADKVDKAKVANASAGLLDAGSHYAKLDEKAGVGMYAAKAEDYLRHYGTSHSSTTTTTAPAAASSDHPAADSHPSSQSGGDDKSRGGYGDYIKKAQSFF